MRLAICADVHLGNHRRFGGEMVSSMNERCRLVLDVFSRAVDTAIAEECDGFIVAGDLFDYDRPEAPLLAQVQECIVRADSKGCQPFLKVGNHDQHSLAEGDHALSPLELVGAIVVEKPRLEALDGAELVMVPFQPGQAREWLPRVVREMLPESKADVAALHGAGLVRLLVLHLGIKDARTVPWLANAADAIDVDILDAICEEHGIDYVFAGNWHDRRTWNLPKSNAFVLQLGALCPTGWDNPGIEGYGTVAIFDTEADDPVRIIDIPGPRFIKVRSKKEAQVEMNVAKNGKHKLFVSFDADPADLEELTTLVVAATERKDIFAGEVVPNREAAQVKAKSAAFAAKSAKTFQEAMAGFVQRMPLPDYVSRVAVLERSRGYVR